MLVKFRPMRPFLAVLLSAAPAFATFRCPAKGGAPWSEYRSAHFVLDTDQGAADAQELVKQLEHFHALILQALVGEQVDIPGHLRVLAFSDQTDFAEMANNRNIAAYFAIGLLGEPTIVMPVRGASERPELVAHELAHYLSRYLFPVQAPWFAEGLAEFVQTAARRPGDTAMSTVGSHIAKGAGALGQVVGSVPLDLVNWLPYDERPLPAKELLAWKGREQSESPRGHLYGWLLYHWMWNQRSKAFAQYEKQLGDDADPQAAWNAAFPEFNPKDDGAMTRLDEALDQYRRHGQFQYYKVEAKGDEALATVTPISSTDLHLLMLNVRGWPASADERKAIAKATIQEAFAEDSGNPLAWVSREEKPDLDGRRKVAAGRPGDWRAWYFLALAAKGAEEEAALRKAVDLNPDGARVLNELAWMLATSGRAKEALPVANRALDLAPWDANIVDTLAEVAVQLGQCPQALQLDRRAVRMAADAKKMGERLASIEARCAVKK